MGTNNPIIPQIQDEGVLLSTKQKINFAGAGVTASLDDANNRITVTIPGGGGGSLTLHEAEHRTGGSDVFTAALPLVAIPALNASYISAGVILGARIPTLDASYTQAGVFGTGRIPTVGAEAVNGVLGVANIPALNASYTTAGVFGTARVPTLDATWVQAGVLGTGRIPTIGAESVNGVFGAANIPALNASYVTAGALAIGRIPTIPASYLPALDATYITTGAIAIGRIPTIPATYLPALDATYTTTGVLAIGRIPTMPASYLPALDASYIATNTIAIGRIPTIPASYIPALNASYTTAGLFSWGVLAGLPTGYDARYLGTAVAPTYSENLVNINYVLDGGGTLVPSGSAGYVCIPFTAKIKKVTALGNNTGSLMLNLIKMTYASYGVGSVIGTVSIANAKASTDSTLTGWTTALAADDIVEYSLLAVTSGITRATVCLQVTKI